MPFPGLKVQDRVELEFRLLGEFKANHYFLASIGEIGFNFYLVCENNPIQAMKNIFTFLFFAFITNFVFAQANVFKITATADVPTTLLVKIPDLVWQSIDTINIENSDLKKTISLNQPRA